MRLIWNAGNTPSELHSMLRTLSEEYNITEHAENGIRISFEKNSDPDSLSVQRRDDRSYFISYGRPSLAARGIAYALAGREADEQCAFRTFGILLDATRGNVMTVEHFKFWLRRLALFGYNLAMIYTKDAYKLPGEPYFGAMRGAYTLAEMQEIDRYAKKLNIEMIASVQVLGHLEPVMRWAAYGKVCDTSSAILVDAPESYELIEKILAFWSKALSSRRIHLGMDETQDLGRGRFMDLHGYENPFDIYNRHLKKVSVLCEKYALKPMIWSDMYFRYANQNLDYYDLSSEVPQAVRDAIPSTVQLSYWDYYHEDASFYEKMLKRTTELNGAPAVMASGVWTWSRLWCDYIKTENTVRPCIQACRKTGTKEIIFTLWGDDGGYCEFDSAFAGLAQAADLSFNQEESKERTAALCEAVCFTSYELQRLAGEISYVPADGKKIPAYAHIQLWDDPLMAIGWKELSAKQEHFFENALAHYRELLRKLEPHRENCAAGWINHAWNILNVLIRKIELRQYLERAYEKRDLAMMNTIAERYIPEIMDAVEGLMDSYRAQWMRSFKPFGLEIMQIRMAGLCERYRELARVLEEFTDGEISSIPQLEEDYKAAGNIPINYLRTATGCFFI